MLALTGSVYMQARRAVASVTAARWVEVACASVIIALGLALRLYRLDARSFWLDEVTQARARDFPTLGDVIGYTHVYPDVMPLMNIITWLTRGLPNDEVTIRLPAAIAGTLSILALYLLCRQLWGGRTALVAALLLALLPQQVWYGQEARPYTILVLFVTLQMLFVYRALVLSKRLDWLWLALASVVAIYTHYLALATTAVVFAYATVIIVAELTRALVRGRTGDVRAALVKAALALGVAVLIAACYVPWLSYLSSFLNQPSMGFNRFPADHQPTMAEANGLLSALDFSGIVLLLMITGVVAVLVQMALKTWKPGLLVLMWLFAPLAMFWVQTRGGIVTIWPRYFFSLLPAGVILVARGVEGVGEALAFATRLVRRARLAWAHRRAQPNEAVAEHRDSRGARAAGGSAHRVIVWAATGVLGLLLMLQVVPALADSYGIPKEDSRGMASYLVSTSAPDSVVISVDYGANINWGLRYYLRRFNSPITYFDGTKLDDYALKTIEKTHGTIWGAAYDRDASGYAIRQLSPSVVQTVSFAGIFLFRLAEPTGKPLDDARALLHMAGSGDPSFVASLNLIDAWSSRMPPGQNLLSSPSSLAPAGDQNTVERWVASAGASLGADRNSFVLSPGGSTAQAALTTSQVHAGAGYILSFNYRNPGMTGYQRVYISVLTADGREGAVYPSQLGYLCGSSAGWSRAMLAFTMPAWSNRITLRLVTTGTGSAEFKDLMLWQVRAPSP